MVSFDRCMQIMISLAQETGAWVGWPNHQLSLGLGDIIAEIFRELYWKFYPIPEFFTYLRV